MTIHWGRQKPFLGSQINLAHPLAQRLVALYLMNEASGNTITNLVDGSIGTLTGMAFPPTATSGWNPGENGPALAFDGTDDCIPIGISTVTGAPCTICVNVSLASTQDGRIAGLYVGGQTRVMGLGAQEDALDGYIHKFYIQHYDGSQALARDTDEVVLGKIYQVVGVFESNSLRLLYVDGRLRATETTSQGSIGTIDKFTLGRSEFATPGQYMDGTVENAFLYNRALTASEIMELYLAPCSMFDIELWPWLSAAVAAGLSIPVAMRYYRNMRIR